MAVLTPADIADLVVATLDSEEKVRFTDIALNYQDYPAARRFLRQKSRTIGSGTGPKWRVKTSTMGTAQMTGLFHEDTLNTANMLDEASIPWRNSTANYSFDQREFSINTGAAELVDLIKVRRLSALQDLVELFETKFWNKPSTSSDKLDPYGVPYWVVKNASTGFNGGNPSGFTAGAGGISSSDVSNWKNYTAQYTSVTKEDAIAKLRLAARKVRFMSPVPYPDLNMGDQFSYMTVISVIQTMERLAETQNDSLGNDLASKDGQVLFRGNPVEWVPYLDTNDTQNPIYGINWGVFYPVFLAGWYLNETPPRPADGMHTVISVHIDSTFNFMCTDRRRMFVINTS